MPTFTVSDAAANLPRLLHRIENEDLIVHICVRDAENVVAYLSSARDFPGPDVTPRIAVTEARKTFNALVRTVSEDRSTLVVITRHGKPSAVLAAAPEPVAPNPNPPAINMSATPRRRKPARSPVPTADIASKLREWFPGNKDGRGRPDHRIVRETMYRIYGTACLLGNHTSYRPQIECAHIDDWPTTIEAYAASGWHQNHIEAAVTAEEPPARIVDGIYRELTDLFNHIGNVVPLCKFHHDLYDGQGARSAERPTRDQVRQRRNEVLLLPRVALNVMIELEASCYGRRSVDGDQKPVIATRLADSDQVTLYQWASRAWRAGSYGDVDPVVRLGQWELNLSTDRSMRSSGRILDETPKWWWAEYR